LSTISRRACLSAIAASAVPVSEADAAPATRPIQLHCDLAVDPKREQEMLENFEKIFRPVARKQPGFIDLKMLKLKDAIRGAAPLKYRFELTMASEELRQKWINTPEHAKAWPTIENTLTDKNFSIIVFDVY
jgi:antibiotic biosynthesis monooxygenase (ABM) superfamily enzyme